MKDYIISFNNITFCRNSCYLNEGDWFICEDLRYLEAALAKKPAGIIIKNAISSNISQIVREDIHNVWSELALMRFPKMPQFIAGLTGTNGKTSTSYLAYKLLNALGCKCGYVGTLGVFPEVGIQVNLTSPDAAVLHEILDTFAKNGITHVCMEISSSALDRNRANQVRLDAAVFTSFSQDHLDIHQTMEKYWQAKLKITSLIKKSGAFLVHEDLFEKVKANVQAEANYDLWKYSYSKYGSYSSIFYDHGQHGFANDFIARSVEIEQTKGDLDGDFMAQNLEAASIICEIAGFSEQEIKNAIVAEKPSVPGRMEILSTDPYVIIDFAHTPDGLEKLLKQAKKMKLGARKRQNRCVTDVNRLLDSDSLNKIILVFGCGGNRDMKKRKIMGYIAHKLADYVVITDDNPRNEDGESIRKEVASGCPNAVEIADRKDAIEYAIRKAVDESLVCVLAGKGHEQFQIYGNEKIAFSDVEVAKKALKEIKQGK